MCISVALVVGLFVRLLARSGGVTKYKTAVVIGDNNISHQNGRAWSWFMECLLCLEVLWRRPIRLKWAAEIIIIFTRIPLTVPLLSRNSRFYIPDSPFFARTWFSGVPAHVSCGITAPLFKDIKFNFIQLSEATSLSFYGLFSLVVPLFSPSTQRAAQKAQEAWKIQMAGLHDERLHANTGAAYFSELWSLVSHSFKNLQEILYY